MSAFLRQTYTKVHLIPKRPIAIHIVHSFLLIHAEKCTVHQRVVLICDSNIALISLKIARTDND